MNDLELFDKEWKEGDRDKAREIAAKYVAEHAAELAPLEEMTLEGLVGLVGSYRQAGREEDRIAADMWLLVKYPPQNITGRFNIGGGDVIAQVEQILGERS